MVLRQDGRVVTQGRWRTTEQLRKAERKRLMRMAGILVSAPLY